MPNYATPIIGWFSFSFLVYEGAEYFPGSFCSGITPGMATISGTVDWAWIEHLQTNALFGVLSLLPQNGVKLIYEVLKNILILIRNYLLVNCLGTILIRVYMKQLWIYIKIEWPNISSW